MKTLILKLFCIVFLLHFSNFSFSQNGSIEKATLYIIKTGLYGAALGANVFVNDTFVGNCGNEEYLKLEIDTGFNLIWANAGSLTKTSYIEARLKAGKTYVVNVSHAFSILVPSVNLNAIDDKSSKYELEKAKNHIKNKRYLNYQSRQLLEKQQKLKNTIENGLAIYKKLKEKRKCQFQQLIYPITL